MEPSGVILELRPRFLLRYVVLPFGLMFSVLCIFGGLSVMVEVLRDPDRSIGEALLESAAIFARSFDPRERTGRALL